MKRPELLLELLEDRTAPSASPLPAAWRPLTGDWNGLGTDGIGSYDPSTAAWFLRNEASSGAPDAAAPFIYGAPGVVPVTGDWDGNGTDTVGVFDPATATWFLRNSNSAGSPDLVFQFGAPGMIPVVGDWDGSGTDHVGVFDPHSGYWFLRNSNSAGLPDLVFAYGLPGMRPVVGDWDGNGTDTVGVVDPGSATWFLRNSNSTGLPDVTPFVFGGPNWIYFAGHFDPGGTTETGPDGIGTLEPTTATWFLRSTASPDDPDVAFPFTFGLGGVDTFGSFDLVTPTPPPTPAPAPAPSPSASGIFLPPAVQFLGLPPSPTQTLTDLEVRLLLDRASAATPSQDGIIAVVDRGGRILGVRVEGGVSPFITSNLEKLVFSVDGAVALARTGAFFASDQAPLTSRTIQFLSQTTITQREVESDPSVTDPLSAFRGPGFVAPIGLGGHFPPGVANTPSADLFGIEHTNRDTSVVAGPDRIKGTADDVLLPSRFNVDPAFIPTDIPQADWLAPPDSYGWASGLEPNAVPRGIGTLPGGLPIVKDGVLVGGIGVFYPGNTGFADEEHSALETNRLQASENIVPVSGNPPQLDRSLEAEYAAFVAVGGSPAAGFGFQDPVGGVPLPPGFALPFGRIDLQGITLPLFGPGGLNGPEGLVGFGQSLGGPGQVSGFLAPLLQPGPNNTVLQTGPNGLPTFSNVLVQQVDPFGTLPGTPVPEGFLVVPHDGVGITASQVLSIIVNAVNQAQDTRAAIRLPISSPTRMVIAVSDLAGNIVGLFRMPDATVFSIDVAVAKARNVAYYDDPLLLQPIDQTEGVAPGVAFTNRTFRYLAQPFFPEGIDGTPPGPFSTLNDPGIDPNTGLDTGLPLPALVYQTPLAYDAFNPQTNFHDPLNPLNQNGVVFFPGSVPLYAGGPMIGGLGVSGDGVNQDDLVTFAGKDPTFDTPPGVLRADQVFVRGVRLPYQNFPSQPLL